MNFILCEYLMFHIHKLTHSNFIDILRKKPVPEAIPEAVFTLNFFFQFILFYWFLFKKITLFKSSSKLILMKNFSFSDPPKMLNY